MLPKTGNPAGRSPASLWLAGLFGLALVCPRARAAEIQAAEFFRNDIQPILTEFCYDCHADGANKGKVAFDEFESDRALLESRDLWWNALKHLRAGLMPPQKKPQPTAAQKKRIEEWIKSAVFGADPKNPDPGRVTVRRLNRVEYRNTIRDLMRVDFDTEIEFPPDDSGHGFDNISDVLTLSPMLLEKYLDAAKAIVSKAVPAMPRVPAEKIIPGRSFRREKAAVASGNPGGPQSLSLSYYEPASLSNTFQAEHTGRYQLLVEMTANEKYVEAQFDLNKCQLVFKVDGQELLKQEYVREGGKPFRYEFDRDWRAGEHELAFDLQPLTPGEKQIRSLTLRIDSVTVRGPFDEQYWVRPTHYALFFTKDDPKDPAERRAYACELLGRFATKAFRRPVDGKTVDRLVGLAQNIYTQPGKTFESGVGEAMVAVLASPRFLFREETTEPIDAGQTHPWVDEYALASRLSYFLWSSMPDDELFRLAGEKKLRTNLTAQFNRMLADPRSEALMRNFTGQWLQARDIETIPIEVRAVMAREAEPDPELERARKRFRELRDRPPESLSEEEKDDFAKARTVFFKSFGRFSRFELNAALRQAMRQETEKYFEHVVREDRSLLELIDSDYTFLNKRLADHYEVPGVEGEELRLVHLPANSPRGGVLTQGTVLAVTSNPTRTSPVKRGVFLLENILGMPPSPPPPNVPALEDAAKGVTNREPTLRETLALHREQPLCSSCHNRMDPLGLAFENFNALGRWREKERSQPVDVAGKLITGESFANVQELKRILINEHRDDFYRCLTGKMLTYALGRGLEYYDVQTVDQIVARISKENGRPSALLLGIVESAPFQKTRNPGSPENSKPARFSEQRADLRITP